MNKRQADYFKALELRPRFESVRKGKNFINHKLVKKKLLKNRGQKRD